MAMAAETYPVQQTSHGAFSPSPSPAYPVPPSDTEKQNVGFYKAARVFEDRLDKVRHKQPIQYPTEIKKSPTVTVKPISPQKPYKTQENRIQKTVKLLRTLQSTLTAILSLIIAFFQGRVYVTYLKTKDIPGAWPAKPDLGATLLLFSVAAAAFTFDICMLVVFLAPNRKYSRKFYQVAMGAHNVISSSKTVAYALTAIVCRLGFTHGNDTGEHQDLWSHTCSTMDPTMAKDISASSNCVTQTAAWIFALLQVCIEIIGILVSVLIFEQKLVGTKGDAAGTGDKADYEQLVDQSPEIDQELSDLTPDIDSGSLFGPPK